MGRSNRGGRMCMASSRAASPASLELRFEHDRSLETALGIAQLPADSEDPDGSG